MSKRNMVWLVVIIVVGAVGWVALGVVWGLLAVAGVLIVSEIIERRARAQRRAAPADPSDRSVQSSQ